MGAKTREVGGGSATGVANEFNNFLMQQLRGPGQGVVRPADAQNFGPGSPGWNPVTADAVRQQSNAQQPQQQTSAFQNAFGGMLEGNVNDMSGANNALQQFFQNPGANNLNLPQFQNQFTAPQFQQAQTNALPTNFGQGQTGMADLGGFGNASQSNFAFNPVSSNFSQQLQQLMGAGMQNMQGMRRR
jgi:hypothetical protein